MDAITNFREFLECTPELAVSSHQYGQDVVSYTSLLVQPQESNLVPKYQASGQAC
jgi:hypothetical protein